jgi:hypothetical protein
MIRARAAMAAAVVAVAMALTGAGIALTGETTPTHLGATDRLAVAELDVSGDTMVLVAGNALEVTVSSNKERSRGTW